MGWLAGRTEKLVDDMDDSVVIPDSAPAKKRMGRPPAFVVDPAIKDQIISYIAEGAYIETAFRAVGISDENYWIWCGKAERGDPTYTQFIADLKKAEAVGEIEATRKMKQGKEFFLPYATLLERRHRDRWGRSDKRTVDNNVNIRVELVDYAKLAKASKPKVPKQVR